MLSYDYKRSMAQNVWHKMHLCTFFDARCMAHVGHPGGEASGVAGGRASVENNVANNGAKSVAT